MDVQMIIIMVLLAFVSGLVLGVMLARPRYIH